MEHNFWFWLLEGIIRQVLAQIGVRLPQHEYWGLAIQVGGYAVELLTVMLKFLGMFIGFKQLAIFVAIILSFEGLIWLRKTLPGLLMLLRFL